MKTAYLFAVAVVTAASLPLMALQVDANASGQQNGSATAGNTHVTDSANGNASGTLTPGKSQANGNVGGSATASGPHGTNLSGGGNASGSALAGEQMRPVSGELESKLNSKSAKPGQPVVFKTTQKMTTADGTEIPKGTRLIGHVTNAQAHTKGHAESQLGIAFDRAELKGGGSIPIHSMIESVSPPPSELVGSMDSDAGFGGGAMSGGGGMGGSGRMGGGPTMGGGARGGLLGGGSGPVGGAVGGVGSGVDRAGAGLNGAGDGSLDAAGHTLGATGHVAGSATGTVGNGLNGAGEGTGSLAAHATGFPGVMLRGDASGATSGMLSATGRDIQLESGTQMVLGVAAARQ